MNLISVFEELDRLYESDELETVAADEATETAELEEGIFGTKKDSADFRNKTAEFSRIASSVVGKPLVNVANDMCSLLGRAISEYKTHFDEKDNHQMSSGSRSNHFNTKAKEVIGLYTDLVKTLKKPNNMTQPVSAFERAARKILGGFASQSSIPEQFSEYRSLLTKLYREIKEVDKKVVRDQEQKFYEALLRNLNTWVSSNKKKTGRDMFKEGFEYYALDEAIDEDDLEEGIRRMGSS